jgi:hypothetical protein
MGQGRGTERLSMLLLTVVIHVLKHGLKLLKLMCLFLFKSDEFKFHFKHSIITERLLKIQP